MGAAAWGRWPALRFPSPLIEPEVPISGIRLSDWLHHMLDEAYFDNILGSLEERAVGLKTRRLDEQAELWWQL